MSSPVAGLSRALTEITARFFQAKLSLTPGRLEVLEHEGGDLIVIKVQGFLSKAEAGWATGPEGPKILSEYYGRLLEQLSPMLRVVVQEVAERPLRECWPALDLARDECLYVLTLGKTKGSGRASVQTSDDRE